MSLRVDGPDLIVEKEAAALSLATPWRSGRAGRPDGLCCDTDVPLSGEHRLRDDSEAQDYANYSGQKAEHVGLQRGLRSLLGFRHVGV